MMESSGYFIRILKKGTVTSVMIVWFIAAFTAYFVKVLVVRLCKHTGVYNHSKFRHSERKYLSG